VKDFTEYTMPDKFEGRVPEYQVLLSFGSDGASSAFRDWWEYEGYKLFKAFCGESDE
jgi:hypothetical protein